MADDIVQRLRINADAIDWEQPLAAERQREAADEIERLRAAGDALAKSLAEFNDPQDEMCLLTWHEARRA